MDKNRIKEFLDKSKESRKQIIDFDCKEYKISHTLGDKLNYRIDIKKSLTPKVDSAGIDRDCYSRFEDGLEEAHKVARYAIETYFRPSFRRGFSLKLSI